MKTKIIAKTEQQIREEVENLPKKIKNKKTFSCEVNPKGYYVDELITFLYEKKREGAKKIGVADSSMKVKIVTYWHGKFEFYSSNIETDEEHEKRKKRILAQRLSNYNKRQKETKEKEALLFEMRKNQLRDIISNFGEKEIYEVFQSINLNKSQ